MNPKCNCELCWLDNAPVCAEYEAAPEDDCEDCCKHCRHSQECHPQPIERKA